MERRDSRSRGRQTNLLQRPPRQGVGRGAPCWHTGPRCRGRGICGTRHAETPCPSPSRLWTRWRGRGHCRRRSPRPRADPKGPCGTQISAGRRGRKRVGWSGWKGGSPPSRARGGRRLGFSLIGAKEQQSRAMLWNTSRTALWRPTRSPHTGTRGRGHPVGPEFARRLGKLSLRPKLPYGACAGDWW